MKDTCIDGVDIKKDDYMGMCEKKIICCNPDKVESAFKVVENLIDEDTSIITILLGESVKDADEKALINKINDELPVEDIDIDVHRGNQPVYDFIIGIE